MCLYFIFLLIISYYQGCLAEVRLNAANMLPFTPASSPTPIKCTQNNVSNNVVPGQSSRILQFRVPFMDMNIQNERNLLIMQEIVKQQMYVLHGNELYELIVSRDEKRLSVIGVLAGSVSLQEPIVAKIIFWRHYLILVVAVEDLLEIYQLPAILLAQNAEAAKLGHVTIDTITKFEPIQQLTINGRFHKLFLFNVAEERVMLLTAVNYTKLQSKVRTYEWANTFFDMIEDLTLPAMNFLEVIGTTPKYLLSGRLIQHQSRTITTVYEIDITNLHLRNRQTITISSLTLHAFTFHGRNYLIGCNAQQQQRCNTFRIKRDEVQFSIYRQFNANELTFERFIAGQHFLIGSNQRSVNVYPNSRMDCYASFTTNENDISQIIAHVSSNGESFILLNYHQKSQILLRIVEIETTDGERLGMAPPAAINDTGIEDLSALQQHRHLFEGTVQQLRSLLLQRKSAMDTFRHATAVMRPKLKQLTTPHVVRLRAGNIGIVRVVGEVLQSPLQLMTRIEGLRAPQRNARLSRATGSAGGFILNVPSVAKVKRLNVDNLMYNGTLLEGFQLNKTLSRSEPILNINSVIRTKVLSTPQLRKLVFDSGQEIMATNETRFKVRNLSVEYINGINVTEFCDSLFLRNRDRKLKGRLIMQGETKVEKLQTPLLNNLIVEQLFNLNEPQVVNTKLLIASITTIKELQVDLLNGLNFTEDIAFSGRDDDIEGPVEIHSMSIAGDLLMDFKPKETLDIIDDKETPFQQFYTGKVIINGSLTVDNLKRENTLSTSITVNKIPFSESKLAEKYLLVNTTQAFNTTVRFGMAKVTTQQLTTSYLNKHPTTQHLFTTNQPASSTPLILIFMQAQVRGDIICKYYESKLREISKDAVRHGDSANISGEKIFQSSLTTEHLISKKFNNLHSEELVLKSQLTDEFSFYGNTSFDRLIVIDNVVIYKRLNTTFVNDVLIDDTPLKRDHHFKYLQIPYHLRAHNVVISKINDIPFDTIFDRLSVVDEQLVLHKDLLVNGNAEFVDNLEVDTINDIPWNDYVNNLVRLNENALINGSVHFLDGLSVKNTLYTPVMNDVNLPEIFDNILVKSKPQLITGNYTFGQLRLTNLDVDIINDESTEQFIDTRSENLILHTDLFIPKLAVYGNLSGELKSSFRFDTLNEDLDEFKQRRWRNLVVLGNAHWSLTNESKTKQYEQLEYLYRHAVRSSADQVITGIVHMSQPLITRMRTSTIFPAGVDLSYITRDCLLKNTTTMQIINASKMLQKPLHIRRAIAEGPSTTITILNGIDLQRFHESLYHPSSGLPIEGPLCFKVPPIVGEMFVLGLVNGMPTEPIYVTSKTAMPPVNMQSLFVDEDLRIGEINDINLDYLLENRVRLIGEPQEVQGFLIFENLVFNNETLLQSINGLAIDNLIFRYSDDMQLIGEQKNITGKLIFNGPASVLNLNGENLHDLYENSIFTFGHYRFDNLTIDQGTFMKGLVLVSNMFDVDMSKERERAMVASMEEDGEPIEKYDNATNIRVNQTAYHAQLIIAINELSNLLNTQKFKHHLLYLDYDSSAQVFKHYANESVNDITHLYELEHLSMCEHRLLQLQIGQNNQSFFITNITTSYLTAQVNAISVQVQNYCNQKNKNKVKSKITVTGRKISQIFGMKKYVESLKLFTTNNNHTFLLLHAIDRERNRNEVRVMRIVDEQNDIKDWQTIQFGVGDTMHLFKIDNFIALLSAAVVSNQQALTIYHFNMSKELFKLAQVIDGPYDVMEIVAVKPHQFHLLLSCHNCHHVHVYDLNRGSFNPYTLMQVIDLPSYIDKLNAFTMPDGELFVLILCEQKQDYFYMYRYAILEGWMQSTVGYFPSIELALPLAGQLLQWNDNYFSVLLLCGGGEIQRCSVVSAIIQG